MHEQSNPLPPKKNQTPESKQILISGASEFHAIKGMTEKSYFLEHA